MIRHKRKISDDAMRPSIKVNVVRRNERTSSMLTRNMKFTRQTSSWDFNQISSDINN